MDLYVKQFTVRYQGKDCGPGSIIYDVDQKLAERLISGSNGTIEALPERTLVSSDSKAEIPVNIGENGTDGGIKNDDGDSTPELTTGLPKIDPKKTVK